MLTVWSCHIPHPDADLLHQFVGVFATEEAAFEAAKQFTDELPYVEPFHFEIRPAESR